MPVSKIFNTPDIYHVLERRANICLIRCLIRSKGMYLLDAFRFFDCDRDGSLRPEELYGAVTWLGTFCLCVCCNKSWFQLGLEFSPKNVLDLLAQLDRAKLGRVSYEDFLEAFRDPFDDADEYKKTEEPTWSGMKPRALAEADEKTGVKVDRNTLVHKRAQKIQVELQPASYWTSVWNSKVCEKCVSSLHVLMNLRTDRGKATNNRD